MDDISDPAVPSVQGSAPAAITFAAAAALVPIWAGISETLPFDADLRIFQAEIRRFETRISRSTGASVFRLGEDERTGL